MKGCLNKKCDIISRLNILNIQLKIPWTHIWKFNNLLTYKINEKRFFMLKENNHGRFPSYFMQKN